MENADEHWTVFDKEREVSDGFHPTFVDATITIRAGIDECFIVDTSTKCKSRRQQSIAPILAYLQLAMLSVYGAEFISV